MRSDVERSSITFQFGDHTEQPFLEFGNRQIKTVSKEGPIVLRHTFYHVKGKPLVLTRNPLAAAELTDGTFELGIDLSVMPEIGPLKKNLTRNTNAGHCVQCICQKALIDRRHDPSSSVLLP